MSFSVNLVWSDYQTVTELNFKTVVCLQLIRSWVGLLPFTPCCCTVWTFHTTEIFKLLKMKLLKGKAVNLYSASSWTLCSKQLKTHHTCLYLVVRQRAPQLNEQLGYCASWWSLLLIYGPREDERLSWLCWLTYSGRSGADQWTFAVQRPTFYHWATQRNQLSAGHVVNYNGI